MRSTTARQFVLILLAMATFLGSAQANTMFSGSWLTWESDGPEPVVSGLYSDKLIWGDPSNYGVGSSYMKFQEYSLDTETVLSGNVFAVGRLTFYNGTIRSGTGITSASLHLGPLSDDDDLDSSSGIYETMYTESTPNTGTALQNADYAFFTNYVDDDLANAFFGVFEGESATADLLVRRDFISDLDIASPFKTLANFSDSGINFQIVGFANVTGGGFLTDKIPEPSSLVLFGLAVCTSALRRSR